MMTQLVPGGTVTLEVHVAARGGRWIATVHAVAGDAEGRLVLPAQSSEALAARRARQKAGLIRSILERREEAALRRKRR